MKKVIYLICFSELSIGERYSTREIYEWFQEEAKGKAFSYKV